MVQGINPFDDASGQQFLLWFAQQGGGSNGMSSVVAAGTTIDDATQLPAGNAYVTDTPASAGVKLSNATPIGATVKIFNGDQAQTLKLYPPDDTQSIGNTGDGAAITIAANVVKTLMRVSSTLWAITGSASAS